jgi:hypothetical protein
MKFLLLGSLVWSIGECEDDLYLEYKLL